MSDEIEVSYDVALKPEYLSNGDDEYIAEGRRAYVLELLVSDEGVIDPGWDKVAPKLEAYLRDGASASVVQIGQQTHPRPRH